MTELAAAADSGDRRRTERRHGSRVADLTLPEFRRIVLTSTLFIVVLVLFLWMVRTVVIAAILAIIAALYLRPFYEWVCRPIRNRTVAALISIVVVLVPIAALGVYSYLEIRGATSYVSAHQSEVVRRIDEAVHRLPFVTGTTITDQIRRLVARMSGYGTQIAASLQGTAITLTIAFSIFLFTLGYVLTDRDAIVEYVRSKIPPRYSELVRALETNVRGVLYGAIYGTLVTQTIKSVVILVLLLVFHVPLAVVLAILSFIIGFFPIVGSWSVYVPVAIWLVIFRDNWVGAITTLAIGFFGNTLFISMYVRPKLAAEKSRVLNFYWMFVALVTGVYTFGLVGILLGPVVIGLLKAVLDTVTASGSWRMLDAEAFDDASVPLGGTGP